MRAKLIALVLSVAGIASSLLAVRQQRIEAAHDLAETHREIVQADESLLRLRAAIGARTEPEDVRAMLDRIGETEPILLDWCAPAQQGVASRLAADFGRSLADGRAASDHSEGRLTQ